MNTERYRKCENLGKYKDLYCAPPKIFKSNCRPPKETAWLPTGMPFCNDDVPIDSPFPAYQSINQKLARGCNKKTLVPLPESIMSQPYDFCQWNDSPYISNAAVNNFGKSYPVQSGYIPESCSAESFNDWTGPQFVSSDELLVYSKNQPINSSIGISETPGFVQTYPLPDNVTRIVDNFDIYDPRQTGYASCDRYYLDEMTGQPRYYYDDIDSIRKQPYSRSNVDFLNNVNRQLVDAAFIDRTNEHRQSIQESLMAKRNSEMWQLKQYPLRRDMGNCF